jgi:ABC-type phosphate/phosphonate transport system substrate-binding protein
VIASLAWYPATHSAWDRLWDATRAGLGPHLSDAPTRLTWPVDFASHWRAPDLILSMTCALPLQLGLFDRVHIVGTPIWDVPGLPKGHYASHLVTRADDGRALSRAAASGIAVNALDSQSGWGTLVGAGLTGPSIVTGSHAASMQAVACGRADLAAIDVVTWAMMGGDARLAIRDTTPPTPATPFITARADLAAPLHVALTQAIADMSAADRAVTGLSGLTRLSDAVYAPLLRRSA